MEALQDDIEVLESLPAKFSPVKPIVKTLVSWSKACNFCLFLVLFLFSHVVFKSYYWWIPLGAAQVLSGRDSLDTETKKCYRIPTVRQPLS